MATKPRKHVGMIIGHCGGIGSGDDRSEVCYITRLGSSILFDFLLPLMHRVCPEIHTGWLKRLWLDELDIRFLPLVPPPPRPPCLFSVRLGSLALWIIWLSLRLRLGPSWISGAVSHGRTRLPSHAPVDVGDSPGGASRTQIWFGHMCTDDTLSSRHLFLNHTTSQCVMCTGFIKQKRLPLQISLCNLISMHELIKYLFISDFTHKMMTYWEYSFFYRSNESISIEKR